ncbi:DUF4423 domain-containing protein [Bdellovibrio sp. HCB117]|uniref:DUF4423 domain-containing protein n=1 Tax=Bdellovibrio sp. HCB117 TaxID=3394359 RepID=UPI0039B4BAEE
MESLFDLHEVDVRECLKKLIDIKKNRNRRFSQRAFAIQLGFTSSTFNEILTGKRNLSKKSINKIKLGLGKDPDIKKYLYESAKVSLSQRWYYDAFLELVATEGFEEIPSWIAGRLGISEEQARFGLEELEQNGTLTRNTSGCLVHAEGLRRRAHLRLVKNPQTEDLAKLSQAVMAPQSNEQFYGTLVMAIDPNDFEYIRARVMDVMKEHSDFLCRDGVKKQEVYLLSFGCMPLTKKVSSSK